MGIDSQGNLYVGEASTGRRVQKFTAQNPKIIYHSPEVP
jgi:hypothetical protein